LIRFVDPDDISAEIFLGLLEAHDLGEGETECLTLSLRHPYVFCCNDIKARHIGEELLGEGRVVGSLRLLKWCVVQELANAEMAFNFYEAMRNAGGFLPDITVKWFNEDE
jgi:hypothetical protein